MDPNHGEATEQEGQDLKSNNFFLFVKSHTPNKRGKTAKNPHPPPTQLATKFIDALSLSHPPDASSDNWDWNGGLAASPEMYNEDTQLKNEDVEMAKNKRR